MFSGKRKLIPLLLLLISIGLIVGIILDHQAEKKVLNLYPRNSDGSLASISSIKAVVLLHGFLESPEVWQKIIEKLKANQLPYDIYAPMLPFSGLPLDKASAFNNQVITKYIKDYLESLSPQYNKIVVVSLSYSGAQLIFLANKLPQNIQLILYAPAVFITSNTTIGRLQLSAYSLWRHYCNYKLLG